MKNISTKELNRLSKQYIIDCIDDSFYNDYSGVGNKTDAEKVIFLYETFKSEYGFNIDRYGEQKAFTEWISGLPSSFNVDYTYHRIIQIAKGWGSIPKDATDKEEQKIIDNWFNLIAVKSLQLIRKYNK